MSEELLLKIKNCIENKLDDKNELIDNFYKVKREP